MSAKASAEAGTTPAGRRAAGRAVPEVARPASQAAGAEQPAREPAGQEVAAVYVHAPFCVRRCSYCDFAVTVRRGGGGARSWADALAAELALVVREGLFALAPRLATLYVGGGTPSLLGPEAMALLRSVLGAGRLSRPDLEWTAEANPESFTPEVAGGWRAAGLTRVSLGVQTFHEPALRWMGRLHGAEGAERAVAVSRAGGLDEISIDLMFGLPAATGRDWQADLGRVLALDVPHVSLYGLSVEPATPLGRAVAEGRVPPVDEERYRDEYLLAAERLGAAGYEHYEVSSFARPGHASRHNLVYWDGRPYLGLGNGAHSYARPVRRWNVRAWEDYRGRVLAGRSPEEAREVVERGAERIERTWLGLRTSDGLPAPEPGSAAAEVVAGWRARGWARPEEARVRLTPEGWLLLDELAVALDAAAGRDVPTRVDPS